MEYSNKAFGQALKEIIDKKKIKLRSLANKTNLDYSYFSKLKTRKNHPPLKTIEIIANGLNIPPEYFLEYRIYKIEKMLLRNPEFINEVIDYLDQLIYQKEIKVADKKRPFKQK